MSVGVASVCHGLWEPFGKRIFQSLAPPLVQLLLVLPIFGRLCAGRTRRDQVAFFRRRFTFFVPCWRGDSPSPNPALPRQCGRFNCFFVLVCMCVSVYYICDKVVVCVFECVE